MTTRHDPFFYTDPSLIDGSRLAIRGSEARHLRVVRRGRVGDSITVSDGAGRVFDVRVEEIESQEVMGEILAEREEPAQSPSISIYQALAKGDKADLAIQKLVEIGVDEIFVFVSERSVPDWHAARSAKALARWRAIGWEAAKQSRRAWLPRIEGLLTADAAMATVGGVVLVANETSERGLRRALPSEAPERLCLIVGPEGGFTDSDLRLFASSGAVDVLLGSQILRTETAALVASTAVMYHYGRIG